MTSGATACTSHTFAKIKIRNTTEPATTQKLAQHNRMRSYRKMDVICPSRRQRVQRDAGDWGKVSRVDIVHIQVSLEIFVIPAQGAVDVEEY
jgi:hypothetical protein